MKKKKKDDGDADGGDGGGAGGWWKWRKNGIKKVKGKEETLKASPPLASTGFIA